ncbi:OmpA family protein [Flagellimonas sp. 389]|uniref:OmpA family protein n=1 Tax=Flagellimonas sp. 389 TaxID=2835862 RepID=UPI001BD57D9D|nr:OmpA family protein [Flagellimonas sp. 389]MBS9461712.1 OmpA family protein [Flagellimonas sp. 389]
MRKLIFLLVIGLGMHPMIAQQELERANTYFERAFYSDAIPLYEKVLSSNRSQQVLKNLADSYYNTFDMHSAARWYKTVTSRSGNAIDGSYYFKLNQSLKAIGKYDEAENALKEYYIRSNDSLAIEKLNRGIQYLENISAIGNRFTIENLALNTTTSEFGAAKIDSNLLYTASRKNSDKAKKLYRWNNQNYLDIYSHPLDKIDQKDDFSESLSPNINTKMHEGSFTITKDRKTIYFTRNNFNKGKKKTDSKKVTNLKIYSAEWSGTEWINITELPFNDDGFSTEHPALNKDETQLYFASDRPGGYGSFDLYKVSILSDGLFGNPINLGATINTDKKEQFPHLDTENNLYFASNGHPGFGLLDIFISKYDAGTYGQPDNLGLPVNSGYDDFSISFHSDKEGFFSSNRPSGKGSDDIYSFVETKPLLIEDCGQFIAGTLTDITTNEPIPNGTIRLLDGDGKMIKEVLTDQNAVFKFDISCASFFTVHGSQNGYKDNNKTIRSSKERKKTFDGSLQLLSLKEIEKQQQAEAEKEKEKQLLQEKRAKEEAEKRKKKKIAEAIKKEDAVVKEKNRTIIKTKEIHFDYSLWYLRRESRERLEVVLDVMRKNPNMIIEIGSHTDIRGRASYNKQLSQKRADSVKEYLVSKGIDENRVIAKGYGESEPIVECKTVDACTEEDHEWNRRCEFVIVNWE